MNVCDGLLKELPCDKSGLGYTREPVSQHGNTLYLMKQQGQNFPDVVDGEYYFIRVQGCDTCCETMRVVSKHGDTLTVERNNPCPCISSNAKVAYDAQSKAYIQAAAREIGINAASPLTYDCETNTISLDCTKLAFDSDCGCGTGGGAGGGYAGEKGEAGRDGRDGVGILSLSVRNNVLYWTDTLGNEYTAGTITAARGVQGEKGERGEQGERGEKGEKGDGLGTLRMTGKPDGTMVLALTDGEGKRTEVGSWLPPRGVGIEDATINDAGNLILTLTDDTEVDAGYVRGARGEQGEVASFSVLYKNGTVYVAGPVNAEFYLRAGGRMLGSRVRIPSSGVWSGANPNTGAETLIEVVHNGGVVALGYF